jgi:isoleucyl-tRNA synthetase
MKRIPDVLDTWFDSGSMPYASAHYMGEGEMGRFPADFISESLDQTRAWFYYLHILGVALKGKNAFEHCNVNGIILAEDGKKMSKKLQNYPDVNLILEKYGADALRLYLATSPVLNAENINFSEKDLASITKNTFRMLWNSYSFFTTYATLDNWTPKNDLEAKPLSEHILDKWILAELQVLIQEMTKEMEAYQPAAAARLITPFVDNLSNWYIRRSRKRFWKNENDDDKNDAYQTLYFVLIQLSKLMAPFTPFIAEEIYRNLTDGESVHLTRWSVVNTEQLEKEVTKDMDTLRTLITEGLDKRGVKVRQPLAKVTINVLLSEDHDEILKEELNVKEVAVDESQVEKIIFDSIITPELKLEGHAREIIRAIQEGRKKAGFNVEDRITLRYQGFAEVLAAHQEEIAKEVLAEGGIQEGELANAEYTQETMIEEAGFTFWLKRV